MTLHALLGPSSAHRWMNCTRAPRLEEHYPETTSPYAEEGTAAHALAEAILRKDEAGIVEAKLSPYYDQEMDREVAKYVDIVRERSEGAVLEVEQRLDFSQWVPEGFGTGDAVIIDDNIIEVIDLKYGKGVPVSAIDNPQLRLYGLGAYSNYWLLYDIDTIRMTIVQPRKNSVSTDEISREDLLHWAYEEVRPKARLAWEGAGDFAPSESTCRWCKAQNDCRARAHGLAKLAFEDYAFKSPDLLSDDEIARIIDVASELASWAKGVEEYALSQARDHGKHYPGWKVVSGRSRRKYTDEEEIKGRLEANGYAPQDYLDTKLIGITKMQKLIDLEIIEDLIEKPDGKPTLTRDTDERPAINSAEEARRIFKEEL